MLGLLGIALIASGFVFWQVLHPTGVAQAGTYTEGIVASSLADVEPVVQSLTSVGLLAPDEHGQLTGLLAESWRVSDDATTFDFTLKSAVDRAIVLLAYDPAAANSAFAGTTIVPEGDHDLKVTLTNPNRPFIANFTKPLIPLGPFIVADRSKERISFVARPNYLLGKPHLRSVVLDVFPTTVSLQQAINAKTVDGIASVSSDLKLPNSMTRYTLQLPRKTAAFFNLDHKNMQDISVRQNLAQRKMFSDPIIIKVVTTESLAASDDVQKLLADWRTNNVTVNLTALPAAQVQQTVIPDRAYDVLIFGIDYGADPDPYPFWHSTQRGSAGLNLANFANVDADHMLEAARKTGKTADRAKLYDQFNQILDQQTPWLVIDNAPLTYAIANSILGPKSASGFTPTDRFANIETWHIK